MSCKDSKKILREIHQNPPSTVPNAYPQYLWLKTRLFLIQVREITRMTWEVKKMTWLQRHVYVNTKFDYDTLEPPNCDITQDRKYMSLNRGAVVRRFSRWRSN